MARVEHALRERELSSETRRRWDATEATPPTEQSAARAALDLEVSEWTGQQVDDAAVQRIIAEDTGLD